MNSEATFNVLYLFERIQLGWTVKDANLYQSASMVMSIIGSLCGLYILKHLIGASDIAIIIISLSFKIASTAVVILATKGWHMYLASGIGFVGGLNDSMCRSLISEMVDKNEIAKIFAITTALESLATLFSAPIYTFIYTNTFETFPGAFSIVSLVVLVVCVMMAL